MRSEKQQKVLDRLIVALEELVRHERGEKTSIVMHDVRKYHKQAPPQIDATHLLHKIRSELDMSRTQFAERPFASTNIVYAIGKQARDTHRNIALLISS